MEVTKKNFLEVYPQVEQAVDECTFFSFDLEMSGVQLETSDRYDLIEDRYQQLQECARQFMVLQFGLATFTYQTSKNEFEAKCFSFYLFPKYQKMNNTSGLGVATGNFNSIFTSQMSSIEFLAEEGFDFNKCFRDGISFMQIKQKEALKKLAATAPDTYKSVHYNSEADRRFVAQVRNELRNWFFNSKQKTLVLDKQSDNRLRNLQYMIVLKYQQQLKEDSSQTFFIEKVNGQNSNVSGQFWQHQNQQIKCVRANKKEASQKNNQRVNERMDAIDEAALFCDVVRLLMDSKKPMVGHNALLDLAYTVQSFYKDLPTTWHNYKRVVTNDCFPIIYDTKYLVAQCDAIIGQYQHSNLQEIFRGLVKRESMDQINNIYSLANVSYESAPLPTIRHAENFERYQSQGDIQSVSLSGSDSFEHEAGYDAYMTGAAFACLARILELYAFMNKDIGRVQYQLTLAGVQQYMGRMLLPRSEYAYVNMLGDETEPDRGQILFVYSIDQQLKVTDILARFRSLDPKCRFFFLKEGKRINEDDGQEGFAIFLTSLAAKFAMEKLKENTKLKFKIEEFEFYRQRRQLATLKTSKQKEAFKNRIQNNQQQKLVSKQQDEEEEDDDEEEKDDQQQQVQLQQQKENQEDNTLQNFFGDDSNSQNSENETDQNSTESSKSSKFLNKPVWPCSQQ